MPVYVYALVNAALAILVVGGIVALELWGIATQHRDPGCAEVRLPRRSTWRRPPGTASAA